MEKLGYQILITVLLPGAILLGATWIAIDGLLTESQTHWLTSNLGTREWLAATSAVLAAACLGTMLGSILDSLEEDTYDKWAATYLGLSPEAYWEEWLKYVDSLDMKTNPYIDQMALYFFFESRTAVATFILAIAWLIDRWWSFAMILPALRVPLAVGLFFVSRTTHLILAQYRHRHFAAPPAA